jgi:hypothetical protein
MHALAPHLFEIPPTEALNDMLNWFCSTRSIIMAEAETLMQNISLINDVSQGYDVVIVCTSTPQQAAFWEKRLSDSKGLTIPATSLPVAVDEDWDGGAGNGLGTLYAYQKAAAKVLKEKGIDIGAKLKCGEISVGLFHTAGKGTRLAPLPGAENNNKPGVKLPVSLGPDSSEALTVLESVIKQTGVYAQSRKGRLSVFWGDQVFVPSVGVIYKAEYNVDILAALAPMPSEAEWAEKGLEKYGLICVGESGAAAQIDKVTHPTAVDMLAQIFTAEKVAKVGTSLGSFSVSHVMLEGLLAEFEKELAAKTGKLDTDPHFWMPMTLTESAYVQLMAQKKVPAEESAAHYKRIQNSPSLAPLIKEKASLFGCVDVGEQAYWWDYGQLKLYMKNNILITDDSAEAAALKAFLCYTPTKNTTLSVDASSCVSQTSVRNGGSVQKSVLMDVCATDLTVGDGSILVNVSARKITCGTGCLLYNVVDDSEEGLTVPDDTVIVDIFMPVGGDGAVEKVRMFSSTKLDGGVEWKNVLPQNKFSFEEIYKKNAATDILLVQAALRKERNALRASLL